MRWTGRDIVFVFMFRVLTGGLTFMLLFQLSPLLAQEISDLSFLEIKEDADERYGPSTDLLNGEKYHYPYRSARGNPFFEVQDDQDVF